MTSDTVTPAVLPWPIRWGAVFFLPSDSTFRTWLFRDRISFGRAVTLVFLTTLLIPAAHALVDMLRFGFALDWVGARSSPREIIVSSVVEAAAFIGLTVLIHIIGKIWHTEGKFLDLFALVSVGYIVFRVVVLPTIIVRWLVSYEVGIWMDALLSFYFVVIVLTRIIMFHYRTRWIFAFVVSVSTIVITFNAELALLAALGYPV